MEHSVRSATLDDLAGIAAIYDPECLHGLNTLMTEARTRDEWRAWMREHESERYPALVVRGDVQRGEPVVLGWASLSKWSERAGYARTAENSVYVHHAAQGRGVGRALMTELLAHAKQSGVCLVIARIYDGNSSSVAFHASLGFETIGVMKRCGEKFGKIVDVRVMGKNLEGTDEPMKR